MEGSWINPTLCNGSGTCIKHCPRDVIRLDENSKKAIIKYPEDCINCQFCQAYCPQKAIKIKPTPKPQIASWK
jgi:NAD-dependent dihydropyrimidine dehydrogenase PreA subunit